MQEILFRGKRKDNGDWIYGYYCKYGFTGQQKHYIIPDCASALYSYEVIPETVGQFTGLRDNNKRKLIFTNDIVSITALGNDHHQKGTVTIAVVENYMGNTCLCIDGKNQTGTTIDDVILTHVVDVIGNTTDNPELLKGGAADE